MQNLNKYNILRKPKISILNNSQSGNNKFIENLKF